MSRPLTEAENNAAKFPPTKTIAEHILTNAQDSRPVVQDFVLAESLEWELGQEYLFDTDILSVKARQAGFTLTCCRDLFIHHFGTRTFSHGAKLTTATSSTK